MTLHCSPGMAPQPRCPLPQLPLGSCWQRESLRPPTGRWWQGGKRGRRDILLLVELQVWVRCHNCAYDGLAARTSTEGDTKFEPEFRIKTLRCPAHHLFLETHFSTPFSILHSPTCFPKGDTVVERTVDLSCIGTNICRQHRRAEKGWPVQHAKDLQVLCIP